MCVPNFQVFIPHLLTHKYTKILANIGISSTGFAPHVELIKMINYCMGLNKSTHGTLPVTTFISYLIKFE